MSGGSRVTDEMVDAAIDTYETFRSKGLGLGTQRSRARAAIEAALSHQAPAVAVSELEDLFTRIEWPPHESQWVILREDLDALINKASSHE